VRAAARFKLQAYLINSKQSKIRKSSNSIQRTLQAAYF